MLIPNIPPRQHELLEVLTQPDGSKRYMMHPAWHDFLSQLTIELQNNASNQGIVMPKQPAANFAFLNPQKFGAIVYDSDNNVAKINLNGTFKTITTS